MFGMQMGRMGQTGAASWLQTFNSLYANGEKGIAKLDFSDFAGMYQDRARTIPYTAVEQPLGSFTGLNGVTATAPADVNRGVVSARVNLLPSNNLGSWTKTAGATMSVASVGDVHPGSNVFKLTYDGSGSAGNYRAYVNAYPSVVSASGAQYSTFVYLRADAPVTVRISGNTVAGPNTTVNVTTSWQKFSISGTGNGVGGVQFLIYSAIGDNAPLEVYLSSTDIRLATDAHLPYQRVNTSTDYDTAGFPHYLAFNGTNTAYVTPSIDFTGTDKMTVWAGITRLSDTPSQIIAELSSIAESQPGSWELAAQYVTYNYFATSLGLYANGRAVVAFAVPTVSKDFITLQMDLSAPTPAGRLSARRNTSGSANTGVFGYGGNYGNYPLYIGARNGTSLFFNGRIYSLIVRGAESSLSQIEATENLIRKTMRLP